MKSTLNRFSKISLGLSAFGLISSSALLIAPAIAATVTLAQWQANPVSIGNLEFTYKSSTGLPESAGDDVIFSINPPASNNYFLNYVFENAPVDISTFTLDYTVKIINPIVITPDSITETYFEVVDLDSTVSLLPGGQLLSTKFDGNTGSSVTLDSLSGSPQVSPINNEPTVIEVFNTYNQNTLGATITSFQNSFQLDTTITPFSVPEPSSIIGVLALSCLGLASMLKRRI